MRVHQPTLAKSPSKTTSSLSVARSALLQRKCACGGTPGPTGECEECRKKRLQRKIRDAKSEIRNDSRVPSIVHEVLRTPGRPLDAETRAFMEPRFGRDFSHVRVHTDAKAAESARAVNAAAYAVGSQVVFGTRQYAPRTQGGDSLMAHELAHVVQAAGNTLQASLLEIDTDPSSALERDAEQAAQDAITGRTPHIATHGVDVHLHRQPIVDEPAAGCGVCKSATMVGSEVHDLVQAKFPITYQNEARFTLPAAPSGDGILDLLHVTLSPENPPSTVEVGEIKPNNVDGVKRGASDLAFYIAQLRARFPAPQWEVEPMALPAPIIVGPYHDGVSASCPAQSVSVYNSSGLYLYSCAPPRSTIPKSCCTLPPIPVPVPEREARSAREKIADALKKAGIPAWAVAALITLIVAALLDPEPFSKVAALVGIAVAIAIFAAIGRQNEAPPGA